LKLKYYIGKSHSRTHQLQKRETPEMMMILERWEWRKF